MSDLRLCGAVAQYGKFGGAADQQRRGSMTGFRLRVATPADFRAVAGCEAPEVWTGVVAERAGRLAAIATLCWLRHPSDPFQRLLTWGSLDVFEPVPALLVCRHIVDRLRQLGRLGEL